MAKKKKTSRKPAPAKAKGKGKKVAKRVSPKSTAKRKPAVASVLSVQPEWPSWYDPNAPLGSAVRYVASFSPQFNWVGIYLLKGKHLELGPYLGAATEHTRIAVGEGVCGTAVAEDADQNVPDVKAASNYLSCSLETKSELVVLIRDRSGEVVGQIDIDSHTLNAFGEREEMAVKQVAKELGELWPA